jgi:DNA-binding transcriptional regulator YiaG
MASISRDIEYQWSVPRSGGGTVVATRVQGQAVINVDRSQEAAVPVGSQLLSSFLDQFEQHGDIADILPEARKGLASEFAKLNGPTVKSLRLALGLSQSGLADAIGTSQSHISRIEARKEKPNEETIRALCFALHVDANTIMDALARADK